MTVVDLTRPFDHVGIKCQSVPLRSGNTAYTGVIYDYAFDSMQSTYIDFPGHIEETDDGIRADSAPLETLLRQPADVIHLDLPNEAGAVSDKMLEQGRSAVGMAGAPALIIKALGRKNPRDINERSVFLDDSAVDWIIRQHYRLLVSDIYESRELLGVFKTLFSHGVTAICEPVDLFRLPPGRVFVSAIPCPLPGVTQLPCRLFAEF